MSKRLLSALMALCLMFGCMLPVASAVEVSDSVYVNTDATNVTDNKKIDASNGLLVSPNAAANTMRDVLLPALENQSANGTGSWVSERIANPGVNLLTTEIPESIEELKKAAEIYDEDDLVVAFVVLEDAPLADTYTSPDAAPAAEANKLAGKQEAVINQIQAAGVQMEVRYQFTYLTNSISVQVRFGDLEKIMGLKGIKSVFLAPVYYPCETVSPNTASSGAMTGVDTVWEELGYTGTGMRIAIIDTGLDLDHPSFAADPETNEDSLTADDVAAVLEELNSFKRLKDLTADKLYRSAKVPYAFNYVDRSLTADHSRDGQGDHGTHVAGIAAANKLETTSVVGMAPDAQLIVMKVFGANGGAYTDDIVAALEDAMTLNCDVVNASLGKAAGFSSEAPEVDRIYKRLAKQNIVATISAGNEGTSSYDNMWGTDLNRTQNPDNGAVGSPSTYANAFSIASAENEFVMTNFFSLADGTKVFYMDSIEYLYGNTMACMAALESVATEYVIVPNLGDVDDFYDEEGNSIVAGKIAVIKRGELSFADKAWNATNAGAVAVVIWNNNDTDDIFTFGMTTESPDFGIPYIPVCLVTLSDGQRMADAEKMELTPTTDLAPRKAEGGQMSSFSSWGVAPDLRLLPDITGIGGNVYSCYDGGQYGLMSGTSMSAPQVAGITALVMQSLKQKYPDAAPGQLRELAIAVMMSTADPIIDSTLGYFEASPRQQGAGLVDAYEAATAETYLTVNGARPKAELGDNAEGVYTFTFEVHNTGAAEVTYALDSSLLTEYVAAAAGQYFMMGFDYPLSGAVEFDAETVTVAAGGTEEVNVTITLSDDDKAYFAAAWENGGYVEGYIYLYNEEGEAVLNMPFLGFYGDWTDAPVFDSAYWYDNSFWGEMPVNGLPEGDEYYNVMWTSLAGSDWVLGINPYSGAVLGADGKIIYDPAKNMISPNGDGVMDGLEEMYLSLLRNAKELTFTYTMDGMLLHQEVISNARKTMYLSNYGQVVPWIYSWYGEGLYDFTYAGDKVLPNGSQVLLTIEATVDYADGGENVIQIPITIDTEMPELMAVHEVVQGESAYLYVEAKDAGALASVVLMNPSGSRIYGQEFDITMEQMANGNMLAKFDVTGLGTEFTVAVCDYAANESYYTVTYKAAGENLPEVDTTKLYAYRTYDNYLLSDHMYGWVSLTKPEDGENSVIEAQTDDYLEYAAINAAEYVDGKIFAVDAVGNLTILQPGLFDRKVVTNLGVNVLDMTFDDSTDTMYVLAKLDTETILFSMDLLTGELTEVHYFGYYYYAPWAIADDDNGTLYTIKIGSANVYTLDEEFAMVPVKDAEGNDLVLMDADGSKVSPSAYAQSITYVDGTLYWAYFKFSYYGGSANLIAIDPAAGTYTASPYTAYGYDGTELVAYSPVTELVGLIALNETEYKIPAAEEVSSIALNADQLILSLGQSETLKASWLPWNYELDTKDLVWSSSDDSIVTVENGVITAVAEGAADITVSYGDLSASCTVVCVEIGGHFEAYNYYTGDGNYGYMIDVDMSTMDYSLVGGLSPVDFVAGDYNGHDGYFYGYDMGGQFYRYDYADGTATALGTSMGTYPVDMAYNYATGMMYVLLLDPNTYENTLYAVNMHNGALVELAKGMGLMTLACATDGTLYAVDAYGYICMVEIMDYTEYGAGMLLEPVAYVLEEPFGDVFMLASMCWDHNNQVLLWNYCDAATVIWIDVEQGYYVNLGDPSESGVVELVGMHVVPEDIEPLPEVAVEGLTAEDMLILTGYEKVPAVSVAPFNATCQDIVLTSADPEVVKVSASGTLVGVAAGTAEVTATLEDTISGESFEATFTVTVMDCADNLYGHLLTDIATMAGQLWIQLDPGNPGTYAELGFLDYTIFTETYVDGKIYTYGYDSYDYTANWQYMVIDAATLEIENMIDMGKGFPYVYDMTYDYVTGTMYVLAGASEDNTDLYVADMETGSLILLQEIEPLLMAIAAGADGKLYAIENTKEIVDEWDPWATPEYTNAMLHVIDPVTGEMELVGDTGMKSNMISSMAYDYDTDGLYWTPLFQGTSIESCLALVNTETGVAVNLGTIGTNGAQVGGLFIISDTVPETDTETLHNVLMAQQKLTVNTGDSAELSVITMPGGLDAEMTWTSSNEAVATVEDGVVTGVAQGSAVITVSVSYNGVTLSASCKVAVLDADAAFLTWNSTDMGWAEISRSDYGVVTNLTEGEEVGVITIASAGTDVYGYDVNNQLFKLNTETFERTPIGDGLGIEVEEGFQLNIKDMAYYAGGDQMIVLADLLAWDPDFEEYSEIVGGCGLYVVDLTTGKLEQIYAFEEYAYVYGMTTNGYDSLYFYNTFDDGIRKLDMFTGEISNVVSLQTQSMYGDMYCHYSMHYDALTDVLYMLFTSNGRFYKMVTVDATLGTLQDNGYVGEIVEEGWYYNGDLFNGLTFVMEENAEEEEVKWISASTSLEGNIGLNFYVELPAAVAADENAFVRFTFAGQTLDVPVGDAIKTADGYRFTCPINAKNMADTVTAQVMVGDTAEGKSVSVSVKTYCEFMIANSEDAELVSLMKAMLNYGAAAQVLFGYNTDNLANAGLSEADKTLADIDASGFGYSLEGKEEGIVAQTFSLMLETETTVRVYFRLTGDKTIDAYTFTVDGVEVEPIQNSADEKGYYVEIPDIAAQDLDAEHVVTVGGLTVKLSAMSYVKVVMDNAEAVGEAAVNIAKALFHYNKLAESYFN